MKKNFVLNLLQNRFSTLLFNRTIDLLIFSISLRAWLQCRYSLEVASSVIFHPLPCLIDTETSFASAIHAKLGSNCYLTSHLPVAADCSVATPGGQDITLINHFTWGARAMMGIWIHTRRDNFSLRRLKTKVFLHFWMPSTSTRGLALAAGCLHARHLRILLLCMIAWVFELYALIQSYFLLRVILGMINLLHQRVFNKRNFIATHGRLWLAWRHNHLLLLSIALGWWLIKT